jgi:hypothetical protein
MIFHQNIRGLYNKIDEILNTTAKNRPHVLSFTEHHSKTYQLENILFQNYKFGVKFCKEIYRNGRVCIFIQESLQFSNVNVYSLFCKEKDLEACVIKLYLPQLTYIDPHQKILNIF